ncbi:MAG: soluble lytic murein transglycosylase [Caulobacteraceae bacterium]|nr:soluble lytic murein transglycosylase [Caulobacteraceae bacterium]
MRAFSNRALRLAVAVAAIASLAAPAFATSHRAHGQAHKRPAKVRVRPAPVVIDPAQLARAAFYSGDVEGAFQLATESSERWIAGLSAFRLGRFADARTYFDAVSIDGTEEEWLRAGAAFWAARSAIADGAPEVAATYLQAAAQRPWTFYGMLAEAQLGIEPQARFATPPLSPMRPIAAAMTAMLIKVSTREPAQPAEEQRQSPALGGFGPREFPTPVLQPTDGFTLDPALVYAIVRQESRFNPDAVSRAGAVGLMQIMPGTAALTTGDDSFKRNSRPLRDPSTNLRIGQDYFVWLLQHGVGDDLMSAIAAYNAGPGTLLKTQAMLGGNADPLMVIECLPAQETRAYVEKVMANYWLYRRQFGAPTASLDALAAGASKVSATLEHAVTAPAPPAAPEVTLAAAVTPAVVAP